MSGRIALGCVLATLLVATPVSARGPSTAQVDRGKSLYGRYCLACHGANGGGVASARAAGAGPLRNQTVQQAVAPSLRGVGAQAADFYLRTGYMPLRDVGVQPKRSRVELTNTQLSDLIAYVASLGKGPAIPTPHPERGDLSTGQQLFTEHCAGCHQIVAQGGYVTGAVPPSLDKATPTQIAEAVRIGPYLMPRFSARQISDRQVASLVRYIEYSQDPQDAGGWDLGHLGPIPEGLVAWIVAGVALVALARFLGKRIES
jgi:ubiquinol-cytochrome c reductase cytochrome c subunit